jgi:signal transduction histidine kinase/ligand-binding sensor domain-containing protein
MGLLLLAAIAAPAREVNSAWYERSWESADGLPDNSVCGVAQTPDEFLWVATSGGLMRFDGVRFERFPLANLDGVPNRVVRAMLLDRRGRLWLDMDRGPVVCIAPEGTRVFTNRDLPDVRATSMADDAHGAVWITYDDGRLVRIQNGHITAFDSAEGWPANGVSSLASDVNGQLWFSKGRQIGVFRAGRFHTLLTLSETVWCIGQRREGGIWICAGHRLLSFDEGGKTKLLGELPAERNGIEGTVLLEDRAGALWVGTVANGLFRCNGTNMAHVPTSYRHITSLMEDREGNIWAGTAGGGLDRLRPRVIELLGTASGLPYETVRSVCQDVSGRIWVVVQGGPSSRLECWQDGSWNMPPEETNLPEREFSCVAADPHGGLWIGTFTSGIYHLKGDECKNWRRWDGLFSDNIRSILESSNGDLYVATSDPNRVQRFHNGRWKKLRMPVHTHSLRALVQDTAGRVWTGSADGYLLCIHGDRVSNETPGATNRLLSIRCLCATPDGSLLIGYAGWGIGWLKNGHFARITTEQGLYDDYVSQIVADNRGWLWCAGNRGIFRVQMNQLLAVAEGQSSRVRCIVYSRGEGFPNLQPDYENSPGALRSRDGRIWFPMQTGLAVIYPDRVPTGIPPPPVLLTQVTMDGQTIGLYDRYMPLNPGNAPGVVNLQSSNTVLRLSPSLHKLNFEFTALSFTAPENVEFQYRLQHLDTNWVEGGEARSVTYSRLSPGRYRFQVRASEYTGGWNQHSASLSFIVLPFYWETWWFRVGALTAFTLGIVAVVRYISFRRLHRRLRLLEQQAALQRERARIAKDIHDDLGANLTQIAYLGELAQQDQAEPTKAASRIEKISATARQAVKSLDEIVWAVNPRNDTLAHLIEYAGQFALDYLRTAGIRCRLDFPEQSPARELSTDLRHNLFLVIKEALHNIVKHAHAGEVWLRASFNDQALDMTIEDNGCGFKQEPDDTFADGLRNMRQRMSDIGGECRFESQPGQGMRVILHLPWPPEEET